MQGATDATGTACPAGDQPQPEWIFYLPSREQSADSGSSQPDRHLCATCHGLFCQQPGLPYPGICPRVNPRNSDLAGSTGDIEVAEPVLVKHAPEGWNFILHNNMQGAAGDTGQPDWRFCEKCNGLFFAPQGNATGSACPLGGEHLSSAACPGLQEHVALLDLLTLARRRQMTRVYEVPGRSSIAAPMPPARTG
jgi:hypothetical protein